MSKTLSTLFNLLFAMFLLGSAAIGLAVWIFGYSDWGLQEAHVFEDPRHSEKVVVLRRFWWGMIPMPPGSGSDAPGVARLVDAEGNTLQEAELEMIQLAYDLTWEAHEVRIAGGLIATWPLPAATGR